MLLTTILVFLIFLTGLWLTVWGVTLLRIWSGRPHMYKCPIAGIALTVIGHEMILWLSDILKAGLIIRIALVGFPMTIIALALLVIRRISIKQRTNLVLVFMGIIAYVGFPGLWKLVSLTPFVLALLPSRDRDAKNRLLLNFTGFEGFKLP